MSCNIKTIMASKKILFCNLVHRSLGPIYIALTYVEFMYSIFLTRQLNANQRLLEAAAVHLTTLLGFPLKEVGLWLFPAEEEAKSTTPKLLSILYLQDLPCVCDSDLTS